MSRSHWLGTAILCGIALAAPGCDKAGQLFDKATEGAGELKDGVADKGKDLLQSGVAQVQEQANLAGSIDLSVADPTQACYVNFIPQGSGRPTVLQLQSYREAKQEAFPSVFLQAQVDAEALSELVDQTIDARLFVQPQENGPVLFSENLGGENANPVKLKIVSLEEKLLTAELVSATLRNTATGENVDVTGTFTGVLP
jgi:hypothetical protein